MISDIADMVDRVEQRNAPLYTRLVQLFSRSCIGNMTILQICKKLMDKAVSIASTGDHMAELGKLLFMLGHYKQALNVYKQTLQAEDSTSAEALIGWSGLTSWNVLTVFLCRNHSVLYCR
jgi:hypothetical protein